MYIFSDISAFSETQEVTTTGSTTTLTFPTSNIELMINPSTTGSITITKFTGNPAPGSFALANVNTTISNYWSAVSSGVSFTDGFMSIPISILDPNLDPANLVWLKRNNSGDAWSNIGGIINGTNLESQVPFNSFSEFTIAYYSASLNLNVFLEGPFISSAMNNLLASDIPVLQPYNSIPWEYNGNESVDLSFLTANNIVDWVLIELRTGSSASEAITVAATRAALLRNDGVILDTDGSPDIKFNLSSSGEYYLAIYHRNHLSILSSSTVTF